MFIRVKLNAELWAKTGVIGFHAELGLIMKKPVLLIREEIAVQWWDQEKKRQPLFYLSISLADFEREVGQCPAMIPIIHLGPLNKWPVRNDEIARELQKKNPGGHAIYAVGRQRFFWEGEMVDLPIRVVAEILPAQDEKMGTMLPLHFRNDDFVRDIERELFGQ